MQVVLQSRELSVKLVQWSAAISTGIVQAVKQAQDVVGKPSNSSSSAQLPQVGELQHALACQQLC